MPPVFGIQPFHYQFVYGIFRYEVMNYYRLGQAQSQQFTSTELFSSLLSAYADTYGYILPDDFLLLLDALPEELGTAKCIYLINPKLTDDVGWYFFGLLYYVEQYSMQKGNTEHLTIVDKPSFKYCFNQFLPGGKTAA